VKPKPIFPLHGTPLIRLLLGGLKKCGFTWGFVNLHYKPEAIRQCIGDNPDVRLKYLYEEELSGSKILVRALPHVEDYLFVINGDVFMELEKSHVERMVRKLRQTGSEGVLLVRESDDPDYPSIMTEKGIFKGRNSTGAGSLMYTGAALFKRRFIEAIDDISFFTTLENQGFKFAVEQYDGIWMDIGSPRLYFDAHRRYVKHLETAGRLTRQESFSENVVLSDASRAEGSIIWENTELTGNSSLSNCMVLGNLTLRDVDYSNKIIYTAGSKIKITDF
jgi:mannose-1-phosphate guanylyltransferase